MNSDKIIDDKVNSDKITHDSKSQFDIYQQQAINHFIGPCLLIAPAGSGKTSVLIQRIISLVQKDVPPENILALTFSKKAQEEMVQRLQPLLKEDYSKVNVLTYHSLCHKYEGIGKKLITYPEQQNILDSLKIALSLDENINANSISKICSNKLKGNTLKPFENDVLNCYIHYLEKYHLFNYDILLINFLSHLTEDLSFRDFIQSKYKFILVDECQDNNSTQNQITKIIAAPENNIFFVGDDDQTIYSFTGSSVENIINLNNIYPDIKNIHLKFNYRCSPEIIYRSSTVISNNSIRITKDIIPGKKQYEPSSLSTANTNSVEFLSFEKNSEKNTCISNICQQNIEKGVKTSILYRNKFYAQSIILELKKNNINFYLRDPFTLYKTEIIRDIHSFLCCISDSANNENWHNVLKCGMPFISDKQVDNILSSSQKLNSISMLISDMPKEKAFLKSIWQNFYKKYLHLKQLAKDKISIEDKIECILSILKLHEQNPSQDSADALQVYKQLANNCISISELTSAIKFSHNNDDTDESKYNVYLYTIHSSKGKQFDSVILIGLEENILPSQKAKTLQAIEEERRVCYVGMTRAINNLYMIYCSENGPPSRFLIESLNWPPEDKA